MAVIHNIKNLPFKGEVIVDVEQTSTGATITFASGKWVFAHTYGGDDDGYTIDDYYSDSEKHLRENKIDDILEDE